MIKMLESYLQIRIKLVKDKPRGYYEMGKLEAFEDVLNFITQESVYSPDCTGKYAGEAGKES